MNTDRNPQQKDNKGQAQIRNVENTNDATEVDGSPVLDEQDLEENNLSVEDADAIEWEESSGNR